jgi:apolipoprotein N-acyltransferase
LNIKIITLIITSGILTGLSFYSSWLSSLIWFSLVPFFLVISKIEKDKERFFCGLFFGFVFYLTSIFWLAKVTRLGLICLVSYLSLYPAFFSFLGGYFFKKPLNIFTISSLWVIFEFLQEHLFWGFGWLNLGYSQYKNLYLIQIIDLLGIKFISFFIVMINVVICEIILRKKIFFKKIGLVIFILIICFIYSFFRLGNLKGKDSLKVSVVQPNVSQELKWNEEFTSSILEKLKSLTRKTDEDSLVIFPEASWPFLLKDDNFIQLKDFVLKIKRDVLIGAVKREKDKFYNTALFINREGKVVDVYRKIKLVPFGEYVPLRKYFSFIKVINAVGDISRGSTPTIFSYKRKKFSVLICFEDIFPAFVRKLSKERDFLVNITNDAWFGGEPEATQHLSIMVARAIENRISIVRCGNTGISGWVSFWGEIETLKKEKKEVLFEDADNFDILLRKKRSFYNKYGDVFILLCSMFLMGAIISNKRR